MLDLTGGDDVPPAPPPPVAPAAVDVYDGPESFETATPVKKPSTPLVSATEAREIMLSAAREMTGALPPPEGKPGKGGGQDAFDLDNERYLISTIFVDAKEVLAKCAAARITPDYFYDRRHALIYQTILKLWAENQMVETYTVAQELQDTGKMEDAGGFPTIAEVSGLVATTLQVSSFIKRLRSDYFRREALRISTWITEQAKIRTVDGEAFVAEAEIRIERLNTLAQPKEPMAEMSALNDFSIPAPNDPSVLLGNRFLNRGDALILSGTSGIGKSSMSIQAAILWALGRPAFGIYSNGKLRSLLVQSEDSDGDIAEIWHSIAFALALTEEEKQEVRERVRIVTDRTSRGSRFLQNLKRHIEAHKPDLVWINPLQAFMDGDITQSQDLGRFLREGLNALNTPPTFGFIVVHHTTKPATGKDRTDRLWHEVMYDMAGGAELINWARGILSLRPDENEGEFQLVLAKRGRRANVKKVVSHEGVLHTEIVTRIPLKHCGQKMTVPGYDHPLAVIFWEQRPWPEGQAARDSSASEAYDDNGESREPSEAGGPGRQKKYTYAKFQAIFPDAGPAAGRSMPQLHKEALALAPISRTALNALVRDAMEEGFIACNNEDPAKPTYFKKHFVTPPP